MRVEFSTIDGFLEEVEFHAGSSFFNNVVRAEIRREPEQEEGMSFVVGFHASAIVTLDEGVQLIHFDGIAGRDDPNDPGVRDAGTEIANLWHKRLTELTKKKQLRLTAGKYEMI